MTDLFLKVNKDLYKLKLNANEQLILSYILEFQEKNLPCFISNESFAEYLNTSETTVSRTLRGLEDKGYISRDTKNIKGGKSRNLAVNLDKINIELYKKQNDP